MLEGVPFTFGGVPPAHILNDKHIATSRCLQTKIHSIFLVIRRALKENRKSSFRHRPADVGVKSDAITHLGRNITLKLYLVPFGGEDRAGCRNQDERSLPLTVLAKASCQSILAGTGERTYSATFHPSTDTIGLELCR